MKRSLLAGLGLSLLSSVQLLGCVDGGTDEECLPGDKDCADPSADGKGDAWDRKNDPRYFASNLEYTLSALPKKGTLDTAVWKDRYPNAMPSVPVAWADTYWPSSEGSHNHRWMGASVKSPLEKYDAAFNNAAGCETQPARIYGSGAKAAWDAYYTCAGPAAKWQMKNYQGISRMHDGIDNNGDGVVDDYGSDRSKGVDGIQSWWGTCHAWAPAALMLPEPQRAVTLNGQRFEVADIKALAQNIFDRTSAVMLGGRCNNEEINHDVNGSANDECADVNPGALHVIMTNFIGLRQAALIEDRTANYEVWNQPVLGFEVTKQAEISKTAANQCVGNTTAGSTWTYNPNAKKLYEVRMTVTYLSESGAEARPVGWRNHTATDRYHYILELNDAGKVIGGRYCTDSTNTHIDFLWSPTGSNSPSNPNVDVAKVQQLIKLSVEPEQGGGGGGTTRDFSVTPGTSIPDNTPAGVDIQIPVEGVTNAKGLAVAVDISHTYRGDLVLKLSRNGTLVKTLHQNTGGSADNLVETYTLTAAEIGSDVNGTWTLNVADTERIDTGTVNKVVLSFTL
jgi:hypothetical protein